MNFVYYSQLTTHEYYFLCDNLVRLYSKLSFNFHKSMDRSNNYFKGIYVYKRLSICLYLHRYSQWNISNCRLTKTVRRKFWWNFKLQKTIKNVLHKSCTHKLVKKFEYSYLIIYRPTLGVSTSLMWNIVRYFL